MKKGKYADRMRRFFELFNGPAWRREGNELTHYCNGCHSSREDVVTEMESLLLGVMFRSQPTAPSLAKWTKLGPCCDWFVLASTQGTLRLIFDHAFGKLASKANPCQATSDGVEEELDWHQVAGRRCARAKRFLHSEAKLTIILMLSIVLEPLRHICSFFLLHGIRPPDTSRHPPLFDLIWGEKSLISLVLQYYSAMLAGSSSRLELLWRRSSVPFASWREERPQEAQTLRKLILVASSWVRRRFVYDALPWSLLAVTDERRRDEDKRESIERFAATRTCCLPMGIARELRRRGIRTLAGVDGSLKAAFLHTGWLAWLSIVSVEATHATHRLLAHPRMPWHVFAACARHTEAKALLRQRRLASPSQAHWAQSGGIESAQGEVVAVAQGACQQDVGEGRGARRGHLRAQSAVLLHRRDMLAEAKCTGSAAQCCSAATWAKVKASFERKRLLEMEADAAKSMAKRQRLLSQSQQPLVRQPRSLVAPVEANMPIVLHTASGAAVAPYFEGVLARLGWRARASQTSSPFRVATNCAPRRPP